MCLMISVSLPNNYIAMTQPINKQKRTRPNWMFIFTKLDECLGCHCVYTCTVATQKYKPLTTYELINISSLHPNCTWDKGQIQDMKPVILDATWVKTRYPGPSIRIALGRHKFLKGNYCSAMMSISTKTSIQF